MSRGARISLPARRAARFARILVVVALVGVVGGLVALAVRRIDGRAERAAVDARFAVRGHRAPSTDVVIVAFDNDSLRRLNVRPPLPRNIQAKVVEHLDRAGARVIAFDYSLEQPSDDVTQDRALVMALLAARNAVISVVAPGPQGDIADLAGLVSFADIAVRPGYTPLRIDPQGVVRQFTPAPPGVPTFAIAAADEFSGTRHIVARGALIDYPGPTGTFAQISYADVYEGRFDPAAVRGKIVVVGPTATVEHDGHHVPVDSTMPGPEVQAAEIATVLAGFPLRSVSRATASGTAFGAGFVVPLLVLGVAVAAARFRRTRRGGVPIEAPNTLLVVALGSAVGVAWLVVAQVMFDRGTVTEVVPVLAAVGVSTGVAILVASAAVARERRRIRTRFADGEPGIVRRVLASTSRRGAVTASDVIAGYTIDGRIGGGGMGDVYRATQTRLDRSVALKLIRSRYALDRGYRRRFVDEAYRAAGISHPNVIPVIDAGEEDGLLYIAMQLVDGSDLGESLSNVGGIEASYAVRLVHRIACALDRAHEENVVHSDVKPANILIPDRSPEHPFLTDFGVARAVAEEAARAGVEGSFEYLAPERLEGRCGRESDIYALAAMLYECLTGTVPFPRASRDELVAAHRSAPRPRVSDLRPDLGESLDEIIAIGMAIDPDERYGSATALTRAAATALRIALVDDAEIGDPGGDRPGSSRADPPPGDDIGPTEIS